MAKITIRSKGVVFTVLFDDEDLDLISNYRWFLHTGGYAYASIWNGTRKTRKNILMHRLIMGFPKNIDIDHKNRNKLDNRRINLRFATRSQNIINKKVSGIRKKILSGGKVRWQARIKINQKENFLGVFNTKKEAQKARARKEYDYYGEFACNYQDLLHI